MSKKMEFRSGDFFIVPNRSALRSLSVYDRAVFLTLCDYADSNGVCWPSHQRMSDDNSISKKKILASLEILEKEGLIQKTKRKKKDGGDTSNKYQLILKTPSAPQTLGGVPSGHPGGAEETLGGVPHGNTNDNQYNDTQENDIFLPPAKPDGGNTPNGEIKANKTKAPDGTKSPRRPPAVLGENGKAVKPPDATGDGGKVYGNDRDGDAITGLRVNYVLNEILYKLFPVDVASKKNWKTIHSAVARLLMGAKEADIAQTALAFGKCRNEKYAPNVSSVTQFVNRYTDVVHFVSKRGTQRELNTVVLAEPEGKEGEGFIYNKRHSTK